MADDMMAFILLTSFCGIAGLFLVICACICCWLENKTKHKKGEGGSFTEEDIRRTFTQATAKMKKSGRSKNELKSVQVDSMKKVTNISQSQSPKTASITKSLTSNTERTKKSKKTAKVAFVEIYKLKNDFEFKLFSKNISEIIIYEWLLRAHPHLFVGLEIIRVPATKNVQRCHKYLEFGDEPFWLNDWIVVVAKSNCLLHHTVDDIFSKMFTDSPLKKLFVKIHSDLLCARYRSIFCVDDEEFRRDLFRCLSFYELDQHTKRQVKKISDAHIASGGNVSCKYFTNLAHDNNLNGAHWLAMYSNRATNGTFIYKAMEDYKQILKSFFFGFLRDEHVVGIGSKRLSNQEGIFLLIYHPDYRRQQGTRGIFALDKAIRRTGIKCALKLKLDIYSVCHVRRGNHFGIRPTILKSQVFDTHKLYGRCSMIDNDYTENYHPDFSFEKPDSVWYNKF